VDGLEPVVDDLQDDGEWTKLFQSTASIIRKAGRQHFLSHFFPLALDIAVQRVSTYVVREWRGD
jgi:hypothetical protein